MIEFLLMLIKTWWGILIISAVAVLLWLAVSVIFYRVFFKRFYDIILSGTALVVFSLIIVVMYFLVRGKLGNPTMFKQYRPGKNNKMFVMHKFRTMTDKKDEHGELLPDSERMTKFGRFIRSTSLDELPQLWDIFRGKMSIIGPRPQLMKNLIFMSDEDRAKRHKVRPGLTGLAQVNGRNNLSWKGRFEFDLYYAEKLSFWLDVKIFFKTVALVLRRSDTVMTGTATSCDYGDELLRAKEITPDEYLQGLKKAREFMDEYNGKPKCKEY